MKHIKTLKSWGIYQLTKKEVADYDFNFAVIPPETMECYGPKGANCLTPGDADWQCDTVEEAINWINHYGDGD